MFAKNDRHSYCAPHCKTMIPVTEVRITYALIWSSLGSLSSSSSSSSEIIRVNSDDLLWNASSSSSSGGEAPPRTKLNLNRPTYQ